MGRGGVLTVFAVNGDFVGMERHNMAFVQLPHNTDAEKALLGALMMNNRAYDRVEDFLRPEHFYEPAHASIFAAMQTLINRGQQASPVTLKSVLADDAAVNQAGGMQYIAAIAGSVVTIINSGDYGRLVHDLYLRREMVRMADVLMTEALTVLPDEGAVDILEAHESRIHKLGDLGIEDRLSTFDSALQKALNNAEVAYKNEGALIGVTTGLTDLDQKLGGLHPSDLMIIAGRPSMGKTALANTIAAAAAEFFAKTDKSEHKGKAVAFFSLEMSADQLAGRFMAHEAKLNSHHIRIGQISKDEFGYLHAARVKGADLPIWIDDTPGISVAQIRSRCRRVSSRNKAKGGGGLGLIVVDYLQLIGANHGERSENRVQEISSITRQLKGLAKELGVPVIALSQLSRAVEQREDKRPQLADLRESGSIEQDADVVMFVYREQYYLERDEPQQRGDESTERYQDRQNKWQAALQRCFNTAEAIIGKQRHGPIGTVRLRFEPKTTWFSDLNDNQNQHDMGM